MGIVDSFKGFIGIDNENDDYDEYDDNYDEEYDDEEEEEPRRVQSYSAPRRNNIIPVQSAPGRGSISIIKIKKYEDAETLASILKSGRPIIFDVGEMEEPKEAGKVVDFMSGAVFGLDGNIKRVSGGIFLAVPNTMNITNDEINKRASSSIKLDF